MPSFPLHEGLTQDFVLFFKEYTGQEEGTAQNNEVARFFWRERLILVRKRSEIINEVFCSDEKVLEELEQAWSQYLEGGKDAESE